MNIMLRKYAYLKKKLYNRMLNCKHSNYNNV